MNDVRGDGPVVFFDGDCILCNGFADFVMRRDRRHALRLATLQGETAAALLPDEVRRARTGGSPPAGNGATGRVEVTVSSDPGAVNVPRDTAVADASSGPARASWARAEDFSSVIVRDGADILRKSEAVRRVLRHMGGPWRVAAVLIGLVPRVVRDAVYDVVARHRLRWFGRRAACRMPTPEERARFLP